MQFSSDKPDFYNDKAARDRFLKEVLHKLYHELNMRVWINSENNFVGTYLVASDTANIRFLEKDGNYNGRRYCGIQISILSKFQTPVRSKKFHIERQLINNLILGIIRHEKVKIYVDFFLIKNLV